MAKPVQLALASPRGALHMKTSLRWVLIVGLLLPVASHAAEEDKFFHFENKPKFERNSSDPVLLRYKFKTGQLFKMGIKIDVGMLISQGGQKFNIDQAMDFDAKGKVTEVDSEGNMSVLVKMTRFRMKL